MCFVLTVVHAAALFLSSQNGPSKVSVSTHPKTAGGRGCCANGLGHRRATAAPFRPVGGPFGATPQSRRRLQRLQARGKLVKACNKKEFLQCVGWLGYRVISVPPGRECPSAVKSLGFLPPSTRGPPGSHGQALSLILATSGTIYTRNASPERCAYRVKKRRRPQPLPARGPALSDLERRREEAVRPDLSPCTRGARPLRRTSCTSARARARR